MTRRKGRARRRITHAPFVLPTHLLSNQLPAEPRNTAESRNTEDASKRVKTGVELYEEGSLDAVLVEFERAYELTPSYRLLYSMAQVQTELHDYIIPVGPFERYPTDGGGGGDVQKGRRKEELKRLRSRVASLTVQSTADGAEVYLNDRQLGTIRRELAINSGRRRLRVRKDGVPSN